MHGRKNYPPGGWSVDRLPWADRVGGGKKSRTTQSGNRSPREIFTCGKSWGGGYSSSASRKGERGQAGTQPALLLCLIGKTSPQGRPNWPETTAVTSWRRGDRLTLSSFLAPHPAWRCTSLESARDRATPRPLPTQQFYAIGFLPILAAHCTTGRLILATDAGCPAWRVQCLRLMAGRMQGTQ